MVGEANEGSVWRQERRPGNGKLVEGRKLELCARHERDPRIAGAIPGEERPVEPAVTIGLFGERPPGIAGLRDVASGHLGS